MTENLHFMYNCSFKLSYKMELHLIKLIKLMNIINLLDTSLS